LVARKKKLAEKVFGFGTKRHRYANYGEHDDI
jgi:hypothetical protein